MNRPQTFPEVCALPDWWQRPGEPYHAYIERRTAEYLEAQRRADAAREAHLAEHGKHDGMTADLASGVGTFDGNGNPKGSGWW